MKTIVTVISSLVMGALLANSSFSPLQELHHWLSNKRRFFYALALYAAGFVFLMTGIVSGMIEATLQYEAQGFVFWSAMSTLASVFVGVGLICFVAGRLSLPAFRPQSSSFTGLASGVDWSQMLEGALQLYSEMTAGKSGPVPNHGPVHADRAHRAAESDPHDRPVSKAANAEKSFEMHH